MSEQETYQALKEILPELQSKLRHNIELQYQEELQRMQLYYKKYAEDMVAKRQNEIRLQNEVNQVHLRRELSLIQRQRQQWLTLEQNYRRTIFELTDRLKESKNVNDISALTEIALQNNFTEPDRHEVEISTWKKKGKLQSSNQFKNLRKDTEGSQFSINANSITNMFKQVCNTEQESEQIIIQDRPLREPESSQNKKWKILEKGAISGSETEERAKRQDTLVLSPPKLQEEKSMRNSLLQPPSQNVSSKSSIFWNQQGKKKFLTMIRNIK